MKQICPSKLDEFISIFSKFNNSGTCYYRGQVNAEWKIIPGIGRNENTEVQKQIIRIECKLYTKFKELILSHGLEGLIPRTVGSYNESWQWLMAFQHYGLPTRLIDFSFNRFVALQFAIAEIEYLNKDGAFFIYKNPDSIFEGINSSILTNPFIGVDKNFFFQAPIYSKAKGNEQLLSERRKFMQGSKFFYRANSELTQCISLDREHANNLVKIIIRKEFKVKLIDFLISEEGFNFDIYRGKNEIDYYAGLFKIQFMKLNKENLSEFLKN